MINIKYQYTLLTLMLIFISLSALNGQNSINTSGGNIQGSGGSLSYSIGQIAFNTLMLSDTEITEGVQQVYEISTVFDITDTLELSLCPNPITDFLYLAVNNQNPSGWHFEIYTVAGQALRSEIISNATTKIHLQDLPKAMYLLTVKDGEQIIKTFKIIKN